MQKRHESLTISIFERQIYLKMVNRIIRETTKIYFQCSLQQNLELSEKQGEGRSLREDYQDVNEKLKQSEKEVGQLQKQISSLKNQITELQKEIQSLKGTKKLI